MTSGGVAPSYRAGRNERRERGHAYQTHESSEVGKNAAQHHAAPIENVRIAATRRERRRESQLAGETKRAHRSGAQIDHVHAFRAGGYEQPMLVDRDVVGKMSGGPR